MKLNVKGWKKVHSDEHHSILEDKAGHQLKIAHKSLSKKMRKELDGLDNPKIEESKKTPEKMAEGGEVKGKSKEAPDSPPAPIKKNAEAFVKGFNTPLTMSQMADNLKKGLGFAKGGEVEDVDDMMSRIQAEDQANASLQTQAPTDVPQQSLPQDSATAQVTEMPIPQRVGAHIGSSIKEGVKDAANAFKTVGSAIGTPIAQFGRGLVGDVGNPQADSAPAVSGMGAQAVSPSLSPVDQAATLAAGPANPGNTGQAPQGGVADDYTSIMAKGIGLQEKGIEQQAKAASELAQKEVNIAQQQIDNVSQQLAKEQAAQQAAMEANNAFVQDVKNGFIKPNNYMSGMDTPQRVSTAIGILLSGVGSGLSGQENMAMKFLNAQIDRDLAAQEKNLNSSNNLLRHNLEYTKNMQDARALTRAMINEGYAHQIQQAAAQNKGQAAQAAANMALGQLKSQNAFVLSGIGKSQSGGGGNDIDSQVKQQLDVLRVAAPEKAKALEERYVPGVGVAAIPVPNDVRDQMVGQQNFSNLIQKMEQFAKKNEGSLTPSTINEGKVLAAELSAAYRQATKGGTYKEGEQEFINKIIPEDPTAFFGGQRVMPKLKALSDSLKQQQSTLNKAYGLPPVSKSMQSGGGGQIRFTPKGK